MSVSLHQRLAQIARGSLLRTQGRPVDYQAPDTGSISVGIAAQYASAKDLIYMGEAGDSQVRELIIAVPIGTAEGELPRVDIGGIFYVPSIQSGEPEGWTIESFDNSDDTNSFGGFRRCKCVRHMQKTGSFGIPRAKNSPRGAN